MTNSYWQQRQRANKLKVIKLGESNINELKKLMLLNIKDIKKQIKEFYNKYGNDYGQQLTLFEVAKYKKELKEAVKKYPKSKALKKQYKQDYPKYKIDRLRAFETQLQTSLASVTAQQEQAIKRSLKETAKLSDELILATIKGGTNLTFDAISMAKLEKIVNTTWIGKKNYSERLWGDSEVLGKKLTNILSTGLPQGQSLQKMSKELANTMGSSFNNAFRLIRTESSHIDGQVTLDRYFDIQNELEEKLKYKYDAFLDDRTSSICKDLNSKEFYIDDAVVGENFPPMHPNCRSTTNLIID